MTWTLALNVITISIGLILVVLGMRAVLYFRHQHALMGGNWILLAFYRTTVTITAVCMWFTVARTLSVVIGPQIWISIISGIAIIWLLSIPILLFQLFRQHEGRE